jgi:tRNA-dihydrouridine synthase 1
MMTRKYGADICYTPMLHARLFSTSAKYRKDMFTACAEDRPLVVQFCANDPDILLAAARYVEDHCDAVDINLGCP